jgi:hypothetical protein
VIDTANVIRRQGIVILRQGASTADQFVHGLSISDPSVWSTVAGQPRKIRTKREELPMEVH